ncbi:DNA repair protein RAD50 [Aspergillus heteromorphus CBS 117.55]|uniref:DNA repair protein RAD50 n=1 Tax=Aspergillus heteromorphus CBS 117.55 TaxID=1448321 RepID=A0A317W6C6_9EURO|nr:DNA repair protein RAD50 [Aspergillus heteromorphus CBS 117.55]PWY82164.1 DNA repair protein RAD50 [Aspergillus heteromorphus CBS 117.55]
MTKPSLVDPDPKDSSLDQTSSDGSQKKPGPSFERGFRFWIIIATLCVIGILSSLENTVVTTSLAFIVTDLNMGGNYIWVTNVFFLTSAAVQPLFGQLANIFGRRWITLFIVSLFTLGSGICGGATSGAMLIAGRAVQGMGSGGINMIVDIIVSDLVPLRERGNYVAFVLVVYFVGTALGPWIGGAIVDNSSWRWVFYINLPVGGVSLAMIFFFLHVRTSKEMSFLQKIRRIDYIGNVVLIASTVSVLFALTYGGTKYDWSSWHIVVSLVIGLVGLFIFVALENSPWILEPVVPPRLFSNRTSATVFAATFLNSALLYWVMFFLPVYFQAVLGSSAERSGVQLLPIIVVAVPAAIVAVLILAKYGRYKPLHLIGFAVCTIGLGLFTFFDRKTSTAEWVIFQMIAGGGSGFVLNTLLPATQAGLTEADQAAATATWSFIRSFGNIWGVAIPAAIFNNRFEQLSGRIPDAQVRELLSRGRAYESASASFIRSFDPALRDDIIAVYVGALKRVWQISIVFSGVAFLLVFLEKEITLRTELETEFGLEAKQEENVDLEK